MYTPYLNLKGSINTAIADRHRELIRVQARAIGIASRSLGCEAHAQIIEAEMCERVHLALWQLDNFDTDYEDWVAETQDLRHGG